MLLMALASPLCLRGCGGFIDWTLSPVRTINISIPLGLGGNTGLLNPDGGELDFFFPPDDDGAGDNTPPFGGFDPGTEMP
jgi:hypothetical protein